MPYSRSLLLLAGICACASAFAQTPAGLAHAFVFAQTPAGLALALGDPDPVVAETARRALARQVYDAGSPAAKPDQREQTANALVELLDPSQSPQTRSETLHLLSTIATDNQVPAIAALLADPQLADDARRALQRIPTQGATDALIAGLKSASGPHRLRLVETLAARNALDAIPTIRALTKIQDPKLQWVTLAALGRLGVPPTQITELNAQFKRRENLIYTNAYLNAAFATLERGDTNLARRLFAGAAAYYYHPFQAGAALVGLEATQSPQFLRQSLGFLDEPGIRPEVIRLLIETDMQDVDTKLARAYEIVDISKRVTLLEILAKRNADGAPEIIQKALRAPEPEIRFVAARIANDTPAIDDALHVATRGTIWRRHEATQVLLDIAADLEAAPARSLYETLAASTARTTARIQSLDALEKLADPASMPAVLALKDALFEAKLLVETFPSPRPHEIALELTELDGGTQSKGTIRSTPSVPDRTQGDPAMAAVVHNAPFALALDRLYATLLAAQGDLETLATFAKEDHTEELATHIATKLKQLESQ